MTITWSVGFALKLLVRAVFIHTSVSRCRDRGFIQQIYLVWVLTGGTFLIEASNATGKVGDKGLLGLPQRQLGVYGPFLPPGHRLNINTIYFIIICTKKLLGTYFKSVFPILFYFLNNLITKSQINYFLAVWRTDLNSTLITTQREKSSWNFITYVFKIYNRNRSAMKETLKWILIITSRVSGIAGLFSISPIP